MKYFVILFGFFLLFGFAGNSFAQYMGNNDSSESLGERIGVGLTRDITWPSPIKQIKQFEFEPENVKCNSGLELIFKISGTPACVKGETKIKLIEYGWGSENFENTILALQQVINSCANDSPQDRMANPLRYTNETHAFLNLGCEWKKIGKYVGSQLEPEIFSETNFDSNKPVYPKFDDVTEIINPEHEALEYRATSPVIDDTYLSKNVQQWKDAWDFELQAEYEKYGDEFYIELGRLLMKNEMQYQMDNLGIVNSQDDFKVISGMMLLSLPPHIGFSSIIHATDGHYYWLQGTTHANQVSYYKTTQLQYPDPIEVDFSQKNPDDIPRISILPKGNNDLKSSPGFPVLSQPGNVEFYNETPGTLTIFLNKEGLDEFSFETTQQLSIQTNAGRVWEFSEPGSYHWKGEVPTIIDGKEYELNTGGGILVLSDDMSDLSLEEQMETARTMLIASGLPITGIGQKGEKDTLYINLSEAINELLPESKQYYLERAQNLIPFNVSIKLDEPILKQAIPPQESEPSPSSLFAPPGHQLGDAHEHASILVKIFGDRFDFSHPQYQIKSSWIHFEGLDGNTIHRHSKGITLGYLFDTLSLKLSSDCFVFVEGREFCTNQDYSLKFFINGEKTDNIRDYVINQGDRILISYGSDSIDEIQEQLQELNMQEIIS